MDYQEFTQRVKQHLLSKPGYAPPAASMKKNDKDVIIILQEAQIPLKVAMKPYYEMCQQGALFEDVLKAIEADTERIRIHIKADQNTLKDYEQAKRFLTVHILNAEKNKKSLQKVPHKMIGDMALVCRLNFKSGYTMRVSSEQMKTWGITEEQLFSDALQRTACIEPPILLEKADNALIRYVYTNKSCNNGASLIAYPGFLDGIARKLNDNLILIIPSDAGLGIIEEKRVSGLRTGDWNALHAAMALGAEESASIITKHTYRYDKEQKILETMEAYENRMSQKLVDMAMKMMGPTM